MGPQHPLGPHPFRVRRPAREEPPANDEPRNLPEDFYDRGDGSQPPQPRSYEQHNPYGQRTPYGQQPPYGQPNPNPYGQPPPGWQGAVALPPQHPKATTVLVLGILGLVCCQLTAPFAWVMGNRTLKEIDAAPGRHGGRDLANIGMILGIVGSVLGILVLLFVGLQLTVAFLTFTEAMRGVSEFDEQTNF